MPAYKSLGFEKRKAREKVWREVYKENRRILHYWWIGAIAAFLFFGYLLYRSIAGAL
jgi:hypothetical protein